MLQCMLSSMSLPRIGAGQHSPSTVKVRLQAQAKQGELGTRRTGNANKDGEELRPGISLSQQQA